MFNTSSVSTLGYLGFFSDVFGVLPGRDEPRTTGETTDMETTDFPGNSSDNSNGSKLHWLSENRFRDATKQKADKDSGVKSRGVAFHRVFVGVAVRGA